VRYGDTTAVAGVRGEILLSKDIANHRVNSNSRAPNTDSSNVGAKELKDFDLLVPNIELATGCSPQFLPGQPPSTLAQSLSTRIYTHLHSSRLVDIEDLKIWYTPPEVLGGVDEMVEDDDGDDKGKAVIKAYWTLYIDIMFISLDGNPFDAAWAAALAALRNVRLPRAYWDIDAEVVLCSDEPAEAKTLNLRGLPIACTFVVFAAGKVSLGRDEKDGKKQWILADPDTFEEGLCDEAVTVVVDCSRDSQKHRQRPETRLLGISKVGGTGVGSVEMRELVGMAERRWREWKAVLESNGNP
jgi:exosome complex component RRP43